MTSVSKIKADCQVPPPPSTHHRRDTRVNKEELLSSFFDRDTNPSYDHVTFSNVNDTYLYIFNGVCAKNFSFILFNNKTKYQKINKQIEETAFSKVPGRFHR